MKIWKYLDMAARVGKREYNDLRCHVHGAVGLRKDGALVTARNGFSRSKMPSVHAEARLIRKLDKGSTVFVARVRKNGEYGMSMPCGSCLLALIMKDVKEVYYTTDNQGIYECIDLDRLRNPQPRQQKNYTRQTRLYML